MAFAQLYSNALALLSQVSILQITFYCAFFCLLASLGGVMNTLFDATSGLFAKKNLLGKFACQGSQSAIAALLFYLVFLGALIPLPGGENPAAFIVPYFAEMAPFLMIVFACVITTTIFWTKIPNTFITPLLSLITALALLVQVGWWLILDYAPFKPLQYNELLLPVAERIMLNFVLADHLSFFIIAAYMLLAACAIGSIVMMLWLIVRRNWDDFGRDYYTFAMRRAARRSLFFLLMATAVACYSNWQLYAMMVESFFATYALLLAISALLLILLAIMLIVIGSTTTPMRCKPAAIASLIVFAFVFFIQLIIFNFSPSLA